MDMEKADNRTMITVNVLQTISDLADSVLQKQLNSAENLSPKLAAIRKKVESGYYETDSAKKKIAGKISDNLLDASDEIDL